MNLENILLLSCRSAFLDNDRIYPPLANLYLHQAIKQKHPEVKVTITDDYSNPEIFKDRDAVGVSIMTPQREESKRVLSLIKQNSEALTIAGGPHIRYYFNEVQKDGWDILVPNDGIRAINRIIEGDRSEVIDDFIDITDYPNEWVKPNRLDNPEFLMKFDYNLDGIDSTTAMFTQGCPMACTFCEEAQTSVRWTPFDLIKQELDDVVSLGYRGVYIFDDMFAINMNRTKPICNEMQKRGLIYRCNGQAKFFTKNEDFAKMLSETGCKEIAFGHESGSQTILDNVKKRTTIQQNYESVRLAKKHGIRVKSFLMIGLPGETYETISDTEKFIQTSGIDDFQLACFYPYKGTEIRDTMDRLDLQFEGEGLGAYAQLGGSSECVVRTNGLSSKELINERDRLVNTYKPKSHEAKWKS